MSIKELLEKYTDDRDLIEKTDILLSSFSNIENAYDLLSVSMENIIAIPFITIEMCQLIDEIKREESWQYQNLESTCLQF